MNDQRLAQQIAEDLESALPIIIPFIFFILVCAIYVFAMLVLAAREFTGWF